MLDQLSHIETQLRRLYRKERWEQLSALVETLGPIAEAFQARQLGVTAQCLQNRLESREACCPAEVASLFDDVLFHLSHLSWRAKVHSSSEGQTSVTYPKF